MRVYEKIQYGRNNIEGYNLAQDIEERLQDEKLEEMYFISGVVKDEGYFVLEEAFKKAASNNVKLHFVIGYERKTLSEKVLRSVLELSNTSYIYNNNKDNDFNAKLIIFKYLDNRAEVIVPPTNFTLNGITLDYTNVTCISFELSSDEEQYNEFMYGIKEYIYPNEEQFHLLTEKEIEILVLKQELLVAKTTDLKMPSISDYLKKVASTKEESIDAKEIEEKIKKEIASISKDFDIELDDDARKTEIVEEKPKVAKEKKETKEQPKRKEKEIEISTEEAIDLNKMLLDEDDDIVE